MVTGSESTGKTTLARRLAAHHATSSSPEFARDYLERKGAPLIAADVEPIAHGQRAGEEAARRRSRRLVVKDTDLISTVLYARHYYGALPGLDRGGSAAAPGRPLSPLPSRRALVRRRPPARPRRIGAEEMHALFVATLASSRPGWST